MSTDSLIMFIKYLGTTAGLGAVIALLTERIPAFQRLSKAAKTTIVATLCIVLPLASWAVLQFVPADVFSQLDPVFQQLVVGISVLLTWLVSQGAHWADRQVTTDIDRIEQ